MSATAFLGALELGLVFSLLAFGLFITFRVMQVPDLTAEGSFVLGAAVSAVLTVKGMPFLGLLAAAGAGALAGAATALQQTKLGIQPVLAGVLTTAGLYTINLLVMGGAPNLPLLNLRTVFSLPQALLPPQLYKLVPLLAIVGALYVALNLFFQTQLGLSVRATGDNETMVRASSIDTDAMKMVAFALSNALVALSGALLAQLQRSSDINMGAGMMVVGLASLIIGQAIIRSRGLWAGLLAAVVGAVLYRLLIATILSTALPASFLKLISALVVAITLSIPKVRRQLGIRRLVKREGKPCLK